MIKKTRVMKPVEETTNKIFINEPKRLELNKDNLNGVDILIESKDALADRKNKHKNYERKIFIYDPEDAKNIEKYIYIGKAELPDEKEPRRDETCWKIYDSEDKIIAKYYDSRYGAYDCMCFPKDDKKPCGQKETPFQNPMIFLINHYLENQ